MATLDQVLTNISFFKILLGSHFKQKLLLPEKLIRLLRETKEGIRDEAIVRNVHLAGDIEWRVKVETEMADSSSSSSSSSTFFFGEGWDRVVDANHLQLGYFLLFHHGGDMLFYLTVFDHSCCCKIYAPRKLVINPTDQDQPLILCSEQQQDPITSVDQYPPLGENMHDIGNRVVIDISDTEDCKEDRNPDGPGDPHDKHSTEKAIMGRSFQAEGSAESLKRAFFSKTISAKYLLRGNSLYIPCCFDYSKYLNGKSSVIVKNGGGPSFRVNICRSHRFICLGNGFKRFCHWNNVKGGDVCLFEILDWKETDLDVVLHVNILRM